MQRQVNLTLNLPNNDFAKIVANPAFQTIGVNLVTPESNTIFSNKTMVDESNDIAANKININGETLTIGPSGAINPGDILTYAGPGLANFVPTYTGGNVLSVAGKMGTVTLVPADVGLGNVDNTSDANKPVSTATQTALNLKVNNTALGVTVATLGLDGTLDPSQIPPELLSGTQYIGTYNAALNIPVIPAAAPANAGHYYVVSVAGTQIISAVSVVLGVGDHLISNGTVWQAVPNAQNVISVNGQLGSVVITPDSIGLSNVDNTSDANKPISDATQLALNLKVNRSDIVDALNVGSSILPLSANQGMVLNATKLGTSDIVNNLLSDNAFKALSANQGLVLNNTKLNVTDIVNDLSTGGINKALSAEQGKILANTVASQLTGANIANNLFTTDPDQILSAAQGPVLNTMIGLKINTSAITNDLATNSATNVLSAAQGYLLNNTKINTSAIVNDLATGGASNVLSAAQGVVLNTTKVNTSAIIDNLLSVSGTEVLSANQGRILNNTKINTSAIVNDLTTGGASNVLAAAQGVALNSAIGTKINTSAIVNDLTTGGPTNVLSAQQGVVLKGLVDAALTSADIVDDLVTDDPTLVLSAAQGYALENSKIPITAIVNDLVTGGASNVLSAAQGVILNTTKIGLSDIIDNLTTNDATKALSAAQGVVLQNTKFNSADVVNDLVTGGTTKALSAQQGVVLNAAIATKINTSAIINNLTTGGSSNVLSAAQGVILQNSKLNVSDVVDDLTTGGTTKALSAQQGVVLQSTKINTSAIINDLTTGGTNNVLSAQQGVVLNSALAGKINTSAIVNDLTTGGASNVLSAAQGVILNTAIGTKINTSNIVNNLTTNDATKVLSAAQGYALQNAKMNVTGGIFDTSFSLRNISAGSAVTFSQDVPGNFVLNGPGTVALQVAAANSLTIGPTLINVYKDIIPIGPLNLGTIANGYNNVAAANFQSTGNTLTLTNSMGQIVKMDSTGNFKPETDGLQSLGGASNRWSVVYASNGVINTSDVREKKDLSDLPDDLLDIWHKYVHVKSYRWKRSTESDSATEGNEKMNIGVMAQDIILAFTAAGLDWNDYSVVTKDPETDRLGVNYDMVLCIEMAAIRKKIGL